MAFFPKAFARKKNFNTKEEIRENKNSEDDRAIIKKIIDGNTDAFEILLERYEILVFRIVKRHIPHDDVYETGRVVFVNTYKSLPTYKGDADFSHWLSKIAVRTCFDYWRDKYRKKETPISSFTENHEKWLENNLSATSEDAFKSAAKQKEAKELLEIALSGLSAEDRMIMEMVHLEGRTIKETANLLGFSEVNVKVRSHRAKKKMRSILEGCLIQKDQIM